MIFTHVTNARANNAYKENGESSLDASQQETGGGKRWRAKIHPPQLPFFLPARALYEHASAPLFCDDAEAFVELEIFRKF